MHSKFRNGRIGSWCFPVLLTQGASPVAFPAGTVFTLRGIVLDPEAPRPRGASATNAVVVRIE